MKSFTLYGILFCLLFSACRKNKDENPPVINISSPLKNSTVNADSFIHLKAMVSDDKKLEYVTCKVLSLDGNSQISESINFAITGSQLTIDQSILVGDLHTESGTYQIIVEAFDGTNKKKLYSEIIVVEIPRVFRKMMVLRKSGTGFAVDSLVVTSFVNFINRSNDFSSASLSNYYQQLYFAGKTSGVLECYDLKSNSVLWTATAELPSSTVPLFYFNNFYKNDLMFWQSTASTSFGKLRAYSPTGTNYKTYNMQTNNFAACMTTTTAHIVVGEVPLTTGGTSYLSYYFKTGFGLNFTTPITFKPLKIFVLSDHELVVLGNNGTQGELRIYDSNTNGFWEQVIIPSGKIYDAVQLNNDEYVIAHESGLLRFVHSPANLVNLTAGNKAQVLLLDEFNGTLYAGEGNMVKVYEPVTGLLAGSYTCIDSVKAILRQYNK